MHACHRRGASPPALSLLCFALDSYPCRGIRVIRSAEIDSRISSASKLLFNGNKIPKATPNNNVEIVFLF